MQFLKISLSKDYLLIPDLVWDGISANLSKGLAVFISKGIINRLIPFHALYEDTLENLEVVHLNGITLMPGLVDCHVHFAMDCENLLRTVEQWENRPDLVERRTCKAAADYVANGVLAVRDGGDKMKIGLKARDSINNGELPGPLVTAAGQAIFKKGRYGEFLGPGIETVDDALTQINILKEEGIDQLKIIISGLVSFKEFGVVGPAQFTIPELRALVNKAHSLGLKVMAHASSAEAVEVAVRSGIDSVEHGYFLATRQLKLMAEYRTAWIPTVAPLGNLVAGNHLPYEGADMDVIRKSYEIQLARIKEAFDLGVLLGVGTDAGANQVLHGYSYHDELGYYIVAGLSNHAVLCLATSVSAKIIGRDNEIGSIYPGRKPFLIGLPGNPLTSLNVLKKPEWVIMP